MRGLEREKKDKEKSQFVQPAKPKQTTKKKFTRKCHTVFCAVFQKINSKMQIILLIYFQILFCCILKEKKNIPTLPTK